MGAVAGSPQMRQMLLAALFGGAARLAAADEQQAQVNSEANLDVAWMLLGSVGFVMSLFYLLNYHDKGIRNLSWSVVSGSICIFTGVQIGGAWNRCFLYYVMRTSSPLANHIIGNLIASLGWYVLLQVTLAWISGAVGAPPSSVGSMILNMKCWAELLGVCTGASNLGTWSQIQQLVPPNGFAIAGVVPLTGGILLLVFWEAHAVRTTVALGDDGKTDQYETLWEHFTNETENGILCMTMGFLTVQSVRFWISGVLPPANGALPPGVQPLASHIISLFVAGVTFIVLIPIVDVAVPDTLGRYKRLLKSVCGTSAAFSLMNAVDWSIRDLFDLSGPVGSMLLALTVTFGGFVLIFIMDYITDLKCTGERVDRELRALIGPLTILIGFAWKQAFVAAVGTVTKQMDFAPLESLLLALAMASVVVPAWRWFILPVVMHNEVAKALQDAEKEMRHGDVKGTVESLLSEPLLLPIGRASMKKEDVVAAMKNLLNSGELTNHHRKDDLAMLADLFEKHANEPAPSSSSKPIKIPRSLTVLSIDNKEQMQQHNAELEKYCAELEAQLPEIRKEVAELQNVARMLT